MVSLRNDPEGGVLHVGKAVVVLCGQADKVSVGILVLRLLAAEHAHVENRASSNHQSNSGVALSKILHVLV